MTMPPSVRRCVRSSTSSAIYPPPCDYAGYTIALSATRPTLATSIAEIQDQITQTWSTTISEAQARHFLRGDLDPHATAVMVLSLTIGRIVDNAGRNQLNDDEWASAIFDILDKAFLTAQD
jgi:hypothetical protein